MSEVPLYTQFLGAAKYSQSIEWVGDNTFNAIEFMWVDVQGYTPISLLRPQA
jgi:hypothetical protein